MESLNTEKNQETLQDDQAINSYKTDNSYRKIKKPYKIIRPSIALIQPDSQIEQSLHNGVYTKHNEHSSAASREQQWCPRRKSQAGLGDDAPARDGLLSAAPGG
jgi:hypothetical protein